MSEQTSTARLREVRFRFQHEGCWLQETTERHPKLTIVAPTLYLHGKDVHMNLTVHAPERRTVERVAAEWGEDPRIKKVVKLDEGPHGTRFHARYFSEHSIYHLILEHSPVGIGAIRFADGVEYYRLVGESADVQALVARLSEVGELTVTSVRDPERSSSGSGPEPYSEDEAPVPWAALTDKQLQAVVAAQASGYYKWPRKASASAVATAQGLSSSAFLDHLRHAEAKLVSAIVGELRRREPGRVEAILGRDDEGSDQD